MERIEAMRAEVKVDCYAGESCEKKEKFWYVHSFDNQESEETREDSLNINLSNLPEGCIVTIEMPQCPECLCVKDCCTCGFDWNNWIEEEYS